MSEGSSVPPGSMRHACVTCGAISLRSCDTMSTGRSCFNLPVWGASCKQRTHPHTNHKPSSDATSPRALQSSPANGSSSSSSCGWRHSCTANATRLCCCCCCCCVTCKLCAQQRTACTRLTAYAAVCQGVCATAPRPAARWLQSSAARMCRWGHLVAIPW